MLYFNSDLIPLEFTVFQVNIFLPFYPHFHLLFPIIKIFLTGFYSMATGFHRLFITGKYLDLSIYHFESITLPF